MSRAQRGPMPFLLAVVLAGTACSGSGSSRPATIDALASKLGCSDLEVVTDGSQRELGSTGQGSCRFAGEQVHLHTFDDASAQDRAIRIGKDFALVFVSGEGWTVRVATAATAEKVKAKLGGLVR